MQTEHTYSKTFEQLAIEAIARKVEQKSLSENQSTKEVVNTYLSKIREKLAQTKHNQTHFSTSYLRNLASKRRLLAAASQFNCEVA